MLTGCRRFVSVFSILGLLALAILPGTANASVTSFGSASISSLTFSVGGITLIPAVYQASFSGSQVGLNGVQSDFNDSDYSDGSFANTTFTTSLASGSSSVTGSASTTVNGLAPSNLSSSMNIQLRNPAISDVGGIPNQANAQFWGTFTTPSSFPGTGLHSVTADYNLARTLSSNDPGGFADSWVFAGIDLWSDLDGLPNRLLYTSYTELAYATIFGQDSLNGNAAGQMNISFLLSPNTTYDLLVYTGVTGTATSAVPVPGAVWLLGTGLLNLLYLMRKRSGFTS